LDEFFKSNSAIQNTQLTLLNEKMFHNGTVPIHVPLMSMFAASNELPEGEELWALFDRFQFRKVVSYLREPSTFIAMIKAKVSPIGEILTLDDLIAAQTEVEAVAVSDDVYETLVTVRQDLNNEGIIASDRRYKQCLKTLQANAWLEGRDFVDDADFHVLSHMLWSQPTDVRKVERLILDHTNPLEREAVEIRDQVDEIAADLRAALIDQKRKGGSLEENFTKQGMEWWQKLRELGRKSDKLLKRAAKADRPTDRITEIKLHIASVAKEIGAEVIGTGDIGLTITDADKE